MGNFLSPPEKESSNNNKQPSVQPNSRKRKKKSSSLTRESYNVKKEKQKGKGKEKGIQKLKRKRYNTNATKKPRQQTQRISQTQQTQRKSQTQQNQNLELTKRKRPIKRKVVLMFSYCGTGYHGLQIQYGELKHIKTVETDLVQALIKCNAIHPRNQEDVKKIGWSRAGRTDKGVHSARQYVAFKMEFSYDEEQMVIELNKHLPSHIRAWGIRRVPKSFLAHKRADSREYAFLLPTFLFSGKKVQLIEPNFETKNNFVDDKVLFDKFDSEALAFLNQKVFSQFVGTHNFHNYTKKKNFSEPSSKRYIKRMEAEEPQTIGGIKFVLIKIHGQSFMLHQIRKMMTIAITVMRGGEKLSFIEESFGQQQLRIGIVPGDGLLLNKVFYEVYNNQKMGGIDKGDIYFEEKDQQIEEFLQNKIYKKVSQLEKENHTFRRWLNNYYQYPIERK
ncbi:tRNA pseudouridine synthase a [Anaeramoeba flamelloides]|uniref:tRNA pseudouridine synthase a n=1 Tax=Anaeramoeba flamelloides TaxID=1746091 RepID=A0ABQ8X2F7_9EUKA|nr:tRNA pseudouridine synthase a [Anaeramoeba flamelloides]